MHYHNVQRIAALPELYELNIGHAIIGRAVFSGLAPAVEENETPNERKRVANGHCWYRYGYR